MPDTITDEGVARLRERIGLPRPHTNPPHYRSPNEDAFRHVAEAYGDDNPLWCDPSYAKTTRWGGPIAPPHLVGGDTLIGEDEVTTLEGDAKALMKGDPLGGVHAFYSGSFREWWNPLRPGTRVTPAQRPGRCARQDGPVCRPGRARVASRGLRGVRGARPVGSIPAYDPSGTGEGRRAQEERADGAPAVHR